MKSAATSPSLPVAVVAPMQRSAFEQDVAAAGPSSTPTANYLFQHLSSELHTRSPETDDRSLEDFSIIGALLAISYDDVTEVLKDLGKFFN